MNSSSYAEDRTGADPSLQSELQMPVEDSARRNEADGDVLGYYFNRIDPTIAASFTKDQRKALRSILAKRRIARHAVELRRSLRFGRDRFYVIFLAGKERRAYEGMLPKDKAKRSALHLRSLVAGLLAGVALAAALKHFIGFDIIP